MEVTSPAFSNDGTAMKKNLSILSAIAVTAAALVSCNKEQDVNIVEEPQGVPFEIVAGSIETKTANDGMGTNWVTGDKINLFHAVSGETSYVNDADFTATTGGASVKFSGTLASALSSGNYDWFAVYPYNAAFDSPDGTATVTFPAEQTQSGNNSMAHLSGANCPVAGNKKNIAYDVTPTVVFKHLSSVIKVHVTNKTASPITVTGVSFTAPININGAFNLNLSGTSPAMLGTGGSPTTNLTVTSGTPIAVDASADFYLAVKNFDVSTGQELSLTVSTNAGDQTLMTVMPSAYTFAAGKIATLNFNFTNKPLTFAKFMYNDGDWLDDQGITKPASGSGTALTGTTQTVGKISLSSTDGSTVTRVYNSSGKYSLRVYASGGSFTLSSDDNYAINKVSITGSGFGADAVNVNVSSGSKSGSGTSFTWTGLSQDITFTALGGLTIYEIIVFYQEVTASDYIVSLPVLAKTATYDATSTTFDVRTKNVSDLSFSSSSPGYSSHSYSAGVLTINFEANTGSAPRDIVVNVSSASAGFDGTLTITQGGAPTKINTLTESSTGVTITAQVTALTTKGFILTDDTASIYVYLNANPSYSIGQTVTVAGKVSTNSKGLQFNASGSDATVTPGAAGSYVYPTPTTYGLSEVSAFTADGSNRLATYVQFSGVVDHSSSYYNVYVGGTSAINTTLYYTPSTFTSGLVTGDYVTIKGYAAIISDGKMGVYVTEVVESDTAPALIFSDITEVPAAGATNQTHTVTPYRIPGAAPTVTYTGCVSAASINAACTTVTYSVSANEDTTPKTGTIVVTFGSYAYTINVSQKEKVSGTEVTLSIENYASAHSWVNTVKYNSITIDSNITISAADNGNNSKYYSSNKSWRHYENDNASITLTATGGKTLQSVTFTYTSGKNGIIVYSETQYSSGTSIPLSGTTATFSVTHSSGSDKGNVQITSIKVVYN